MQDQTVKITLQMPDAKQQDDLEEEVKEQQRKAEEEMIKEEALKIREIPYVDCRKPQLDTEKLY